MLFISFNLQHHNFPPNTTSVSLRNSCANLCSLDLSCDAFYLDEEGPRCSLVDEDAEPDMDRTVGHYWRKPDVRILSSYMYISQQVLKLFLVQVYFIKAAGTSNQSNPLSGSGSSGGSGSVSSLASSSDTILAPLSLIYSSCDADNNTVELSGSQCESLSDRALTYFTCGGNDGGYAETVGLVSDGTCLGEDRLLQCEMDGREVSANILTDRRDLFEPVFLRTKDEAGVRTHVLKLRFGIQILTMYFSTL